jgi:thiamine-monophosphate kinase
LPIGDDLAALRFQAGDILLAGADQALDGVHFDSRVHDPRAIGRKATNRNLSDCAAMGCLPVAAIVTMALPRGSGDEFARELYMGIEEAGALQDCTIIGGDTASWDGKLAITVAILGRSDIKPITRAGAKVGEGIYLSGPVGGSLLGRHMTFRPRVLFGHMLAKRESVSAMVDISDGLTRDLQHICRASNVGAVLYASAIPIHDDAMQMHDHLSPLEHALYDGEDYELLFTSPHALQVSSSDGSSSILIGQVISEPGMWLERNGQRTPIDPLGWDYQL